MEDKTILQSKKSSTNLIANALGIVAAVLAYYGGMPTEKILPMLLQYLFGVNAGYQVAQGGQDIINSLKGKNVSSNEINNKTQTTQNCDTPLNS
jgi:hypothetical protein